MKEINLSMSDAMFNEINKTEKVSNCCSASVENVDDFGTGRCSDCGDGCEVVETE